VTDRRFATRAVHAGLEPDPTYGSVIPPIHQTSTYVQPAPGEFVEDYDYARSANPTRAALERALGELEGGLGSCFASGMAATHALLTAHCSAGDHVILPLDLYGGTYRLVDKVLKRFGVTYDMVDQTDLAALERAVRDDTVLIWVETPTNPLLNVVDIEAVIARSGRALVAVDNTFATPAIQRPLELGADAVVHSATKYLGGHSDTILGVAVTRDEAIAERLRFLQNAMGGVPGPLDCFLVLRGLRTLHLRAERHASNAAAIARFLVERDDVEQVMYPGLLDGPHAHPGASALVGEGRQMRTGGGMVSFIPKTGGPHGRSGEERANAIAEGMRLFTLAESLGGVESLVEVPATMTHVSVAGSALEVPESLVRLSVGIEAVDDLIADLRGALDRA
jgi:cystathionine gamma-synthase